MSEANAKDGLDAEVIVVGAGPCGTTLANLLGVYGIRTLVVEREAVILDYPRAVGIDDEALRAFQAAGIADEVAGEMVQNAIARYHHSNGKCFAQISPSGQPFGWPRRNMFIQPITEVQIRDGLKRFACVELRTGAELQGLRQDTAGVEAVVATADGPQTLRARYLVGCDGGRSTVRKLAGINLDGSTHAWRWLVIDLENDDSFAPFSGVYCHPDRPYMSIDLPYGHRRFEFRLKAEETDEQMSRTEEVLKLLEGKLPPGYTPQIIRHRIYTHHSRVADRFREGRVFVAGDAAHLQPPFFGQGLNSGLRDAMNLAWKLAAVLTGKAGSALLGSYDAERRHHARVMVKFATSIGRFYAPYSRFTELFRRAFFWAVQRLPGVQDYVLQMKFKPLPHYEDGIVLKGGTGGTSGRIGRMFMQPRVQAPGGEVRRLDDTLGPWFAVIGVNVDPAAHLNAEERAFWQGSQARVAMVNRSRRKPGLFQADPETLVLDDCLGAFRDMKLANPEEEIVFLRPDRYVAAVCRASEINEVSARLRRLLTAE